MGFTIAATNRTIELRQTGISQTQYTLGRMADLIGNNGSLQLPSGERITGAQLRAFALGALNEPALMDALENIDAQDLLLFCDDVLKANGGRKLTVRHLELPATLATKGEYGKTQVELVVKEVRLVPRAPATAVAPPAPAAAPAGPSEDEVLASVSANAEVYEFQEDKFKNNERIARAAIAQNWRQFAFAPKAVIEDATVRASVLDRIMQLLPADLAGQRAEIEKLIALPKCPTTLASELLRPEVGAVLMDLFPASHRDNLPRELLQNPETWVRYADQASFRAVHSPAFSHQFSTLLSEFRALSTAERKKLFADCERLNISHLNRFANLASLKQVIADRDTPSDKPVALVVFPDSDYNGAFIRPSFISDLQTQYRVVYVEAKTDSDFIETVEKDWGKKPEVLLVGGHGYQLGTQFGAISGPGFLDHGDMPRMKGLRDKLATDARVILWSCGTGGKQGNDANIANLMAWAFPNAQVFAPVESPYWMKYEWENNRIKGARFSVKRYTPRVPRL